MTDEPHTSLHMSPAQAARVAGVSRWTIMRAIKSLDLNAIRDNRNCWQISRDDLDSWQSHTVRTVENLHTSHTQEILEIERLKGEVEMEKRLREAAEADRDRWQMMAEKLADRPRRWWPWSK